MKRLTPKYLKGLVAEVIKEERTRRKNPASRYSVQYALYEAKDEEKVISIVDGHGFTYRRYLYDGIE